MKHGSLFSGIGGFDLASQWMGWENVFHCEWNEFGQKVLKHHFPKSISYNDITKTDFSIHRGEIDILTGGFPCQPYSVAGKRLGKEDERHLWPEMLRAIREIQPRYVVGENVGGILSWSGGLVFEEVQTDLESEGYEVWTFILPAAGVNAPHKRDRVWFVAKNTYSNGWDGEQREEKSYIGGFGNISTGDNERVCTNNDEIGLITDPDNTRTGECLRTDPIGAKDDERRNGQPQFKLGQVGAHVTDTDNKRLERETSKRIQGSKGRRIGLQISEFAGLGGKGDWQNFPTQSPLCGGNDGIPTKLDGITFSKWRNESIKAYGNAIVPQVAFEIFKAIELTNNTTP